MDEIEEIYCRRKKHYDHLVKRQSSAVVCMSRLRFLIFLLGIIFIVGLYIKNYYYMSLSIFLVSAILFVLAVRVHEKLKQNTDFTKKLVKINCNSLKRIVGDWKEFNEKGENFRNVEHNYSWDLDIFGENSLFQCINCCNTYLGKENLKNVLSSPLGNSKDIEKRQSAVLELSSKLKWRQHLEAQSSSIEDNKESVSKLKEIVSTKNSTYRNKYIIVVFKIIPIVTIMLLFMSFVFHFFNNSIGYAALVVQIILLLPGAKNRFSTLNTVFNLKSNIRSYEKTISLICKEEFQSDYLKDLKSMLLKKQNGKLKNAAEEIYKLKKISESISQRQNIAYIILNIFFLWDYQCMFAFEKWREQNGSELYGWIETVGKFEMLSSLAVIAFDHSNWTMPQILDNSLVLKADSMAHPLLWDKAVCNNLDLNKNSKVALITGSNMSGKSTFLRTAGINLVLAYSGAPVRAKSFCCSIMSIYTCMRISDNLEKNISSFYGEILRIKSIVEAANRGENIFFLLDEIFKGTNSIDRHTGAKILINELMDSNTCGMVSTHDLELCDIERESNERVKNYHFREYYKDNKIQFDYKLHRGASKTRNALYLMKMAGINVPDD
ncbi:MutS family DNA mismatch repair protein [Clostridium sp. AWRP]|uniref:MutS-related protein n=1 Tax=Clostridium sp. AWRP TaxID=2212991 RepID=UPI000FD8764E|nr:MutS family DNA mismatch repair protein [Clostridium sp. AWRP]AZV57125.1 DNA mismatch repair protein [Clostridium sp. AWRP]